MPSDQLSENYDYQKVDWAADFIPYSYIHLSENNSLIMYRDLHKFNI